MQCIARILFAQSRTDGGATCLIDAGQELVPVWQHVHGGLDGHAHHVAVHVRQGGIVRFGGRLAQRFLPAGDDAGVSRKLCDRQEPETAV